MFRLPIIGVSACARTTGHALSPLTDEVSIRFMRVGVGGMSPIVEAWQRPSPAASAPFSVFSRVFQLPATLHHSAGDASLLRGARPGARYATRKRRERLILSALDRELDTSCFVREGEGFSFDGVKSQVPEVLRP
jgi:hypothetical protein